MSEGQKIRGSYFSGEVCDIEVSNDKLISFVDMLKNRGCYIDENGHIRSRKGGAMSKLTRNGYWLAYASYNRKTYYFCEHRAIWVWYNGAIPEGLEVNHKDYNRGNNKIENLELLTHHDNIEYSRPNLNPCRGEKSPKAHFTNKQAQAVSFLCRNSNWDAKNIAEFVGEKYGSILRIKNKERYGSIPDAQSILEVYPTLVDYTRNRSLSPTEELKDYLLGLNGEAGELTDIFKKILYHGKDFDPVDIMLELGDVLYYLTAICNVIGIDIVEVLQNNNVKLLSRYKDGFSIEQSNDRIEDRQPDKEERL